MRFGQYLVASLERYGVDHVFGIPGVHTAELYRGLAGSRIRHITPRHEQGAGFMGDGYARMTGKPGVCFVITGPGLTNIATAMAQALADSIPMLVISGVNATSQLGHRNGNLHELPDQRALATELSLFSHTLLKPEDLPAVLARAFAAFGSGRPGPVHIEVPTDEMGAEMDGWSLPEPAVSTVPSPIPEVIDQAVRLLAEAQRPLILAGGGSVRATRDVQQLAEQLEAPVVMTVNGRGILPIGHELAVPASPSLDAIRGLLKKADVVLAIGTEIGPTDYDMYGRGAAPIPGTLIRLEIDPVQMVRNRVPELPLLGAADATARALADRLAGHQGQGDGAARAASARAAAKAELSPAMRRQVAILEEVRDALPEAVVVGDSTQAVYAGNLFYEAGGWRGWFNSATGYGTLGYALPAAIGARLGAPDRPVVCLAGDGGLQFTLAELGSAVDAGTPIIVLVWNNRGYGEIKSYMEERGIAPEGVDLATPDFVAVARAYGWTAERLEAAGDLRAMLRAAARRAGPTLIEMDEALIMASDAATAP